MTKPFDKQALPTTLRIKVTTKAKTERVVKTSRADGSILYKVYVNAAPENGKANEAVLKLLAKTFGVAKSTLSISHGLTSREKIIKLSH